MLHLTCRRFSSVAKFGTNYFLLKIKILAKRKRELTTKFAIARNRCWQLPFLFLRFYFQLLFSFLISVKCLFYSCGSFVHFGGRLVYFGGCLFHFCGCLIYFGRCLVYFGGRLVYFGGCLVYFGGRLMQLFRSLV